MGYCNQYLNRKREKRTNLNLGKNREILRGVFKVFVIISNKINHYVTLLSQHLTFHWFHLFHLRPVPINVSVAVAKSVSDAVTVADGVAVAVAVAETDAIVVTVFPVMRMLYYKVFF